MPALVPMKSVFAEASQFQSPEIHVWRNEFHAILPAFLLFVAFPDYDCGVAGFGGQIRQRHTVIQLQRFREHHHATVGIHHASAGFDSLASAGGGIPLQTNLHLRIHSAAAALVVVFCASVLEVTQLYAHSSLVLLMLELESRRVNGTNAAM